MSRGSATIINYRDKQMLPSAEQALGPNGHLSFSHLPHATAELTHGVATNAEMGINSQSRTGSSYLSHPPPSVSLSLLTHLE